MSVAASVYDALDEIAGLYRAATGVTVALNAGGSNTLARQIVEGAKAGLFLSADESQMDVVEKAGRVVPGTRTRLLTNELAVVVAADASADFTLARCSRGGSRGWRWASRALFPPACTGAGGSSTKARGRGVEPKVVPFPTVRAVLSAVEAGRVDAGIVYRTDAMTSTVRVIARVSPKDHPYLDIAYPAAVIVGSVRGRSAGASWSS